MRGAVVDDRAPELFGQAELRALGTPPRPNAHGVYEPDETLQCTTPRSNGRRLGYQADTYDEVLAEIELVELPQFWVGAFGYSFANGGHTGPLTCSFGWKRNESMARGATRAECLAQCRERLAREVADYVAYHGASKDTRKVAHWLERLT